MRLRRAAIFCIKKTLIHDQNWYLTISYYQEMTTSRAIRYIKDKCTALYGHNFSKNAFALD
ncbi:hypothetical protein DSUL_30073 [Desulfovibrionales bacterium]